jgi:hypothetical protein
MVQRHGVTMQIKTIAIVLLVFLPTSCFIAALLILLFLITTLEFCYAKSRLEIYVKVL